MYFKQSAVSKLSYNGFLNYLLNSFGMAPSQESQNTLSPSYILLYELNLFSSFSIIIIFWVPLRIFIMPS